MHLDSPVWSMRTIGFVRSSLVDKASAPRQPSEAALVHGTIELVPGLGLEDAVAGLSEFSHLWVVFVFHEAGGYRPKVLPPRSAVKRGVLATRSPHRPNPIGLSALRLESVNGLTLSVSGLDLVDGTPVLDVKPYLAYTDAIVDATVGWIGNPADPGPRWSVAWSERARAEAAWIEEATGLPLTAPVDTLLSTGPEPRAYRRIRRSPDGGSVLGYKSWRVAFRTVDQEVTIERVTSGYRPKELAGDRGSPGDAPRLDRIELHREFVGRFGT